MIDPTERREKILREVMSLDKSFEKSLVCLYALSGASEISDQIARPRRRDPQQTPLLAAIC